MDRVGEIEAAIERLPADELNRLAQWVRDRDQAFWDLQLDADSAAGKLDFLFAEAAAEAETRTTQAWPASN